MALANKRPGLNVAGVAPSLTSTKKHIIMTINKQILIEIKIGISMLDTQMCILIAKKENNRSKNPYGIQIREKDPKHTFTSRHSHAFQEIKCRYWFDYYGYNHSVRKVSTKEAVQKHRGT